MPDPLSDEDVAYLNRQAVERSSVVARALGVALVVVGALLAAAVPSAASPTGVRRAGSA